MTENSEEAGGGGPRVSVIVPARNEEENVLLVLPSIASYADEVLLVDGHSTDRTVELARSLEPKVRILHQQDSGKGNAIRLGLRSARGRFVCIVDADCSHDPAEIPRLVRALEAGADVVHGSRFVEGGGSADNTFLRTVGNWGLTFTMNLLCGTHFTDVVYGLFGFRQDVVPHLDLRADRWDIEVEILCRAEGLGLRVTELPSFERRRVHGESHFNGFVVAVRNIVMMMRANPRYARLRGGPVPTRARLENPAEGSGPARTPEDSHPV